MRVLLLLCLGMLGFGVAAQEPWPAAKPISMVVAFPPGGVADLTARPMAVVLERILKQKVLVENRAGAGGAVGNAYVTKARPDGYTLLMALSSVSILPEADKVNGKVPGYTLDQLIPVALVSADPTVLVVRAESPYKTVKDLVESKKLDGKKTDDPWGHQYRIVCDSEDGDLRVYSNGKDGKENTPDDVRDDSKPADIKRIANL